MTHSGRDLPIEKATDNLGIDGRPELAKTIRLNDDLVDDLMNTRSSFLQSLLPDPRRRAVIAEQTKAIESEFAFRREVLSTVRKTQMQEMRECFNQFLIEGKASIRAEVYKSLMARAFALEVEANDILENFTDNMLERYEKAENIRVPRIRDARLRQIDKDIARFEELKNQLSERFTKIISEVL